MKNRSLLLSIIVCAGVILFSSPLTIIAGSWEYANGKSYYKNDDGSFPVNSWQQIDGKWYHFDEAGYMQTGILSFDGGNTYYHLMQSGAMEVNHDYGVGYCDENGIWHDKIKDMEADSSAYLLPPDNYLFFDTCRKYGIDINLLSRSTVNKTRASSTWGKNVGATGVTLNSKDFPLDSEGNLAVAVAERTVFQALCHYADYNGFIFQANYNGQWENATQMTYHMMFDSTVKERKQQKP